MTPTHAQQGRCLSCNGPSNHAYVSARGPPPAPGCPRRISSATSAPSPAGLRLGATATDPVAVIDAADAALVAEAAIGSWYQIGRRQGAECTPLRCPQWIPTRWQPGQALPEPGYRRCQRSAGPPVGDAHVTTVLVLVGSASAWTGPVRQGTVPANRALTSLFGRGSEACRVGLLPPALRTADARLSGC